MTVYVLPIWLNLESPTDRKADAHFLCLVRHLNLFRADTFWSERVTL